MKRALVLYSGSVASAAVARLAQLSGEYEVCLLYLQSPFFHGSEEIKDAAARMFPDLRLKCHTLKRDYLRMAPRDEQLPFPCGACRHVLLAKAARTARRLRAEVVITGEILGRGGMGLEELQRLERSVGLEGRVLRPLSARLLPRTQAESAGDITGEALFDLVDDERSQGRLASLADELDIGGQARSDKSRCSLRRGAFAARVESLLKEGPLTVNNLQLLEFERYHHVRPDLQVVVACSREEQRNLQTLFLPRDVRMYLLVPRSPLALLRADWSGRCAESVAQGLAAGAQLTLAAAGLDPGAQTVCFRLECEEETHRLSVAPYGDECQMRHLQHAAVEVSLPLLSRVSF